MAEEKVDFEKALEINGGGIGEDIEPPKEVEESNDEQFKYPAEESE